MIGYVLRLKIFVLEVVSDERVLEHEGKQILDTGVYGGYPVDIFFRVAGCDLLSMAHHGQRVKYAVHGPLSYAVFML